MGTGKYDDSDRPLVSKIAGHQRRIVPEKLELAREMRRNPTPAEHLVWTAVRRSRLGVRFRRQHPVGPFIVDFYCASARLVVEVDGDVHDLQQDYDASRDAWMRQHGLTVLRVHNDEVLANVDKVLEEIITYL